ncbi:MAG: HEAT repeat domain-containing protein [Betaproteobacteria bacterium]|nr:HEAT repeat domain-containing protein [Betaproteobacteria bacterium]
MFSTLFDPYLRFAFWTAIGAVVLATLAAALIVHLRFGLIRRTRREHAFQSVWRPILVEALVSTPVSPLPILLPGDRVFFLSLWVQLQLSVRGTQAPGLQDVAYRVGCDKFAAALLRHGNPPEKLLAILSLGLLRDRSAWSLLVGIARETPPIRSFCALNALVQIDAEAAAAELTPLLLARNDWPMARIAALLQGVRAAFAGPLLRAAEDAEGRRLIKILRLIEVLRLQLPVPTLSRLLSDKQPAEVIIGALRATFVPGLLPQVRALPGHPDWRVRVQVCKVLGRLGEFQDIVPLSNLLSDREWWVRYCAACALVGLPFVRRSQLDQLRCSVSDPLAREVLEHVLFEKAPS